MLKLGKKKKKIPAAIMVCAALAKLPRKLGRPGAGQEGRRRQTGTRLKLEVLLG